MARNLDRRKLTVKLLVGLIQRDARKSPSKKGPLLSSAPTCLRSAFILCFYRPTTCALGFPWLDILPALKYLEYINQQILTRETAAGFVSFALN
jgi:hypothetical protein